MAAASATDDPAIAIEVSAETREPMQAMAAATAIDPPAVVSNVSAATREPMEAMAAASATDDPAIAIEVSAETREPMQAMAAATAIDPPAVVSNVSAATREPMQAMAATSAIDPPAVVSNVSAATRAARERALDDGSTGAQQATRPRGTIDELDDWPDGKPLLDQIPEVEMRRAAEAAPEGIEHSIGAEPRPASRASALHQRADAVRRAFSRADALVALAQRYLRGDRPNRAPIDVVLTIPASSLCMGRSQ